MNIKVELWLAKVGSISIFGEWFRMKTREDINVKEKVRLSSHY
jgi:hypothetical protein